MIGQRKTAAGLTALCAAVAVVASGCSSAATPSKAASSINSTVNEVNLTARSAVKQGGTLTLPMSSWTTEWNQSSTVQGHTTDTEIVESALLPTPWTFDATGTGHVDTDYLESATESTVAGKQTVTYELNPKAVWSDDSPVTAADWIADWKAQNGTDSAYQSEATGYNYISSMKQGSNQFEVTATFGTSLGSFADWRSLFDIIYPAEYFATPAEFNNDWLNKIPLTSGPFSVADLAQTDKIITLVPNKLWWGATPKLSKIVFKVISGSDQAAAFANGEIDEVAVSTVSDYATAKKLPNSRVDVAGGLQWEELYFDGTSAILSDSKVRQALMHAVDRSTILKSEYSGLPYSPSTLGNNFVLATQKGYKDDSAGYADYSPSTALSLLKTDGWTKGSSGYLEKNGTVLNLSIAYPSGTTTWANDAVILQHDLTALNIKSTITADNADTYWSDIAAGKFDLEFGGWGTGNFPATQNYSLYQQPQGSDYYYNYSRIGTSAINAAMTTAASDTNATQALVDIDKADVLVWQEAADLPLDQQPQIVVAVKSLANYGAGGAATYNPAWVNVGFTG